MLANLRSVARQVLGPAMLDESWIAYRFLRQRPPGVVVEVGAHTGDSAFMQFAADGWRMHGFEPDPKNRAELEAKVRGMSNVTVIPKAVSDKPGKLTFYASPESTGISSLAAFTAGHVPCAEVEVVTLTDYLRSSGVRSVDFLKMDVEGYERMVMAGYPWDTHRPAVVVAEFEDGKTVQLGYRWTDLADDLRSRGYGVLVSEWFPVERYGVRHRWRRFTTYPSQLADEDAWGNLIAVDEAELPRLARIAQSAVRRARVRSAAEKLRGRAAH